MSNSQESDPQSEQPRAQSRHRALLAVVAGAVAVMLVALFSAFFWPGWGMNKNGPAGRTHRNEAARSVPSEPSIKAEELPGNASALLKAMPDSVLNFARMDVVASEDWRSSKPLEEYTVKYSTGSTGQEVVLKVAQWSSGEAAESQYDDLAGRLQGTQISRGDVKVSTNTTGRYVVREDDSRSAASSSSSTAAKGGQSGSVGGDPKAQMHRTTALWRNDTVVFQATGAKESVLRFYRKFPL